MAYEGGCHCGAVTFRVEADIPAKAVSCNCSICRSKGLLLTFVPVGDFRLLTGETELTEYRFNTHHIRHRFCRICGVQPFSEGKQPDGQEMRAINLRCVKDADIDGLDLQKFDGAAL